MNIDFYNSRIAEFTVRSENSARIVSRYSWLRLVLVLAAVIFGWLAIRTGNNMWWFGTAVSVAAFLFVIRLHQQKKKVLEFEQMIVRINEKELNYLNTNIPDNGDGCEFAKDNHAYAHDLDIFGPLSLFHHIARTGTVPGKRALADALGKRSSTALITGRQKAVMELAAKPEFRQEFYARALLSVDNEKVVAKLLQWTSEKDGFSASLNILRLVFPALFAALVIAYAFTGKQLFLSLSTTAFIINLLILASQLKRMSKELNDADNIQETVLRYSELSQAIENEEFESVYLNDLKNQLTAGDSSSYQIAKLSRIVASLASLQNGFGAILLNGTALYHLHAYKKLLNWKANHSAALENWMNAIAETEVLNSFANLRFNNPGFCFPEVSNTGAIAFTGLGHPLIPPVKRVNNDVSFAQNPFIILTGSNMSGKSTFLRTLGINMVLANAGSCICAEKATFQPMDVLVSMRLSDSLSDSESYFFAEVRRLKEISSLLENETCFVLLDEILRGTNSDDKRSGTIGVIENLIGKNVAGAIATHDLEVCDTTLKYPDILSNKCFEVEIINNELHFDYKLREGICKNKSATFLMKKMGIIADREL